VEADDGELYVSQLSEHEVRLHLRGRFSGCPGNALAIQQVIEPALRSVAPGVQVMVSSGELLPEGAVRWDEFDEGSHDGDKTG
jgi:Fe-S cluster biogenesis protein NfuA